MCDPPFYAEASLCAPKHALRSAHLEVRNLGPDAAFMADGDGDKFRVRTGRTRRAAQVNPRTLPFVRQIEIAVRKQGGNPNRIGGSKGSGRFNARGRGASIAAGLLQDSGGWSREGGAGRFRARRVVVKARVVKFASQRGARGPKLRGVSTRAMDAHLRYLQRDGVTRDGETGQVYSAFENGRDSDEGKAFTERCRGDRHQFRFIVAPDGAAEMENLRSFTRDLMRQMESDLGTRLDWIAVDHHNTGHPHTHILIRGVTEEGRVLNIAGDYIAHGIRHRAGELVTLELGPQTEIDIARKLKAEVEAERLTRLDRMLLAEQEEHRVVDLRPGMSENYMLRANRHLLIDRAKRLEQYGLASETEPGRWVLTNEAEQVLRDLGTRNDIIKTMHQALADHGIADERGSNQYVTHGREITEPIVGRVLAKGLAGDEMDGGLYVVVDGVDGRTHYVETGDEAKLDEVRRGHIVSLESLPTKAEPRAADLNIRDMATERGGIYRPSEHLEAARPRIERIEGDPDAFIRAHVRRLEALRRAGIVERIDADHWSIPNDIAERGAAYDARNRDKDFIVRTLSFFDLDSQVTSDGATWLDRELASANRVPLAQVGFGREVSESLERRRQSLVDMGYATRLPHGTVRVPRDLLQRLEQAEVARVGRVMAAERGLSFIQAKPGEYISGRLAGAANLASGRFAMIDDGTGFQLVPWQPTLEKRIGQHITGRARDNGGIEWGFGRKRGLGL
jgi:type IV secretory pathway VirD2 relaxase